ncbi:hypothetical protein G7046_g571 [Stylonectria norvegica]|nr:hypothetical protein G7046_g571 [Stylonectria norvegica]
MVEFLAEPRIDHKKWKCDNCQTVNDMTVNGESNDKCGGCGRTREVNDKALNVHGQEIGFLRQLLFADEFRFQYRA